jgi:hypothetical protein
MLNLDLLMLRFAQYGAVWLASFLLVLFGDLAVGIVHIQLVAAANVLLTTALCGIAVVFSVFVALTALGRESGATKTAALLLGVLLLFPLLWAPMLGAIASAYIAHVSIEYSSVYAGFRIIIGRVIYSLMRLFTDNPYVEAGLNVFQTIATVVGFIASVAQLWKMFVPQARHSRAAEG